MSDYPDEATMFSFLMLARAIGVTTEDGIIEAGVPDRSAPGGVRMHEITGEQLDELVRRGWVALVGEDEIESTERGLYWLNKWRERREKAERRARRAG